MKEVWTDIIFKPRITMQRILQENINYGKKILPFFSGFFVSAGILNPGASENITFNYTNSLILALLLAWPVGWCTYKVCGLIDQKISKFLGIEFPVDKFESIILWSGYLSFFPIFISVTSNLAGSKESLLSITEMLANIGMTVTVIGLSIYTFILSVCFIKEALKTDFKRSFLIVFINGIVFSTLLCAFIFVSALFISMWLMLDVSLFN